MSQRTPSPLNTVELEDPNELKFAVDDSDDVDDNEREEVAWENQNESAVRTSGLGSLNRTSADVNSAPIAWDFREASLPPNAEVVNGEPEFVLQKDGSTALFLPPMAFLKLSFPSGKFSGLGGQLINDYTLTMDILLDSLPTESMSLFQCDGSSPGRTEGETFVYPSGGVGIFGEVGVADASIHAGKWHRVVVTLGPEQDNSTLWNGSYHAESSDRGRDLTDTGNALFQGQLNFSSRHRNSEDLSRPRIRSLKTYVNSCECATVSSDKRGVLAIPDGRFSVNLDGISLFGSNNPEAMGSGKLVKFVEFKCGASTASQVKEHGFDNRIYSKWEKERQAELKEQQSNLTLHGLFTPPPPIWKNPAIICIFSDAFLEGTGLEGGDVATASSTFELIISLLLKDLSTIGLSHNSMSGPQSAHQFSKIFGEFSFTHHDHQSLNYLGVIFKETSSLCRRFKLAKKNGAAQLVHYLKFLKKKLLAIREGECLLLPGGIGGVNVMYIVEREMKDCYRFSVVNTCPEGGLDWHSCDPSQSNRMVYHTVLFVKGISFVRIMDDAFWGMLLKLAIIPSKENYPNKLYDLLLPFLSEKPIDQIVSESESDEFSQYRLPQLSNTSCIRALIEASFYILCRRGLAASRAHQVLFSIEIQILKCLKHDLNFIQSLEIDDQSIISTICSEIARSSSQMGEVGDLSLEQLASVMSVLESISELKTSIASESGENSQRQPTLTLTEGTPEILHPFMERLRRIDDVDGFAGAPIVLPKYIPVDMLQIPEEICNLDDIIAAIRHCDRLCTLISVQGHCLKNRALLKLSLIEHTFASVLPCPCAQSSPRFSSCVWQTSMSYSIQLDIAICLGRIMEHFMSSIFSVFNTKSVDALRLVLSGCIAAMLDATLRHVSTDQPSDFCMRYIGQRMGGRGKGYGISMAAFDTQSESIELHTPQLSAARAAVLDYFNEQKGLAKIWKWSEGHHFDEQTMEFLISICRDVAYPSDVESLVKYSTVGNQLINKNYPEFHILRDVAFYVMYVQNVDPRAFPPQKEYSQMDAELKWDFQQGTFMVEAFRRGFLLECYPKPPFADNTVRYPSACAPSNIASPHRIDSEDDVLHIKNLPSFDGGLGQQDSELLLSFLTVIVSFSIPSPVFIFYFQVPYLRIPLVLSFFSTEDRIHALRSEKLQSVMDSVLFEPERFQHSDEEGEPTEVPCQERSFMSTTHGLLMNEIICSPLVTLDSIIKLLELSLDLDVGTFHSNTVQVVLYVFRIAARVQSFVVFLIAYGEESMNDAPKHLFRSTYVNDETLQILKEKLVYINKLLRFRLLPKFEEWCKELSNECNDGAEEDEAGAIIDANTRSACNLHAHRLLYYRNLKAEEYDLDAASTISSSFLFLATRHTWNMNLLGIPEHELFEMLSQQRRKLIQWARNQQQNSLNKLLESTIRVTTDTGGRYTEAAVIESPRIWAFVAGDRSIGRFTVETTQRFCRPGEHDSEMAVNTVSEHSELGIELDLQVVQLTMKSSHLQALDTKIASDVDVQAVFGKKSMQAALVESTVNRTWVDLIGRGHRIQYWKTPDERTCVQDFDRQYSAGELFGSPEEWIVPIFEPVRISYMTKPFVLEICMPDDSLPPNADVAHLVGIHPKNGGIWKEIFVFKSFKMVQVYNVVSHGRRFYRTLEYTSNCKHSLREMQPALDDRQYPWPGWERHGAGHPYDDHWNNPLSCVITRGWDFEENLSGGEETYIPPRLLYGIIHQSLLDSYMFWQDEDDNLRGYSNDKDALNFLFVELIDVPTVSYLGKQGTCGRIYRLLKRPVLERMSKQMNLLNRVNRMNLVNSSGWFINISISKQLRKIVDRNCPQDEIGNFLEGLKLSGVIYETVNEIVDEIDLFTEEFGEIAEKSSKEKKWSGLSLDEKEFSLVVTGPCAGATKYCSLFRCLSRLENSGHILAWSADSMSKVCGLDLIEFPRLGINFQEKIDSDNISRIYSIDHSSLFVSNFTSALTERLMTGLPHAMLMSNSNNELQILVPAIDLIRPKISSSPFSTELVLNRTNAIGFDDSLETSASYYLYPIHISMSFLFSPTLSSMLYLLLARFLNRDYKEVFRLAESIGTDTEFSRDEKAIFESLGRSNGDYHPDSHACRLKISYMTLDAPVSCPWNLTRQCSRYILKLDYISQACRLSWAEEYELLQLCVCDEADPRFFDSKGQPQYSLYEVTVVKNRLYYLSSLLSTPPKSEAEVFSVPRPKGSRWPVERNYTALGLESDSIGGLEVHYAAPNSSSGHAYCELFDAFWGEMEDTTGLYSKLGFLFIYELLTGTKTVKVLSDDVSRSFAILLTELLQDKSQETLLPSILNIMCKYPDVVEKLPKFNDNRKFKTTTIAAASVDQEDTSPLYTLISQILTIFQDNISTIMGNYLPWVDKPAPFAISRPLDLAAEWPRPFISDFSCSSRSLHVVKGNSDNSAMHDLLVGTNEINSFATAPLSILCLDKYTVRVSREEVGLACISESLPFDVSRHPQAQTQVASSMMSRLEVDCMEFARRENSSNVLKCAFLRDVYQLFNSTNADDKVLSALKHAAVELGHLVGDLKKLRQRDEDYVKKSLEWLLDSANEVSCKDNDEASKDEIIFKLRRFCRLEATVWLEFLFGTVLSSRQNEDLSNLNPFLTYSRIDCITNVTLFAILHANRISQINRCLLDCLDLEKAIAGMNDLASNFSYSSKEAMLELRSALTLKDESLCSNLTMERHFFSRDTPQSIVSFDPRFLLFEFAWSILLRKSQVDIVNDYLRNLQNGVSTVKQMLMGAGKTTVVCPLLALMLGDGESLVVQAVPPALLELSRAVMRSTFSSIMHKRIYTLHFDRSTDVTSAIEKKLLNSLQSRGVVIATPTTIKSMMLKFIELIYILNDPLIPQSSRVVEDYLKLGRILNLFRDGILIMDEVDLILHPMKSELNFPVGDHVELDYSPHRWQLPMHLLDAIFFAEKQEIYVGFKQSSRAKDILETLRNIIMKGYSCRALQKNPHIILLNSEWYDEVMLPVMIDWIYMWIEKQHLCGLSEIEVKNYLQYGGKSKPELTDTIEKNLTSEQRKMLNLSREWLISYLPHVLQKVNRVSYGLLNAQDYKEALHMDPHMPRTRAKLAIPFVGKDVPSKSSEFAHPDVIIGLTILSYRYEGLRRFDFDEIISNLRATMTKEIGPMRDRKSSIRYSKWVSEAGGRVKGEYLTLPDGTKNTPTSQGFDIVAALTDDEKEVVPLRLLKRSNEDQMRKIFNLLKNHPSTILFYLESFIFPSYMDSKVLKLSAAGQELGGSMMFQRRIGFSGTPSDLLPVELGKCGYEKGSDGRMIHVLSSPKVCSIEIVPLDWTPQSLLLRICKSDDDSSVHPRMRYHALIDTGALITGMTNLEVAQFMLRHGLHWCEGVVFLDDNDCKMVLVRATGRVIKMAQCGIPPEKRFSFYDQVHTTGMDIHHSLTAKAALTLSKDMVFRDYAQGAFRMRGINRGQSIHIMIIPEVRDLICRELNKIDLKSSLALFDCQSGSDSSTTEHNHSDALVDIITWLVINSLRSERIQFNQLCIQNLSNIWRKEAFQVLMDSRSNRGHRSSQESEALNVFCEPIDFSLNTSVPIHVPFSEVLTTKILKHERYVPGGVEHITVKQILSEVASPHSTQYSSREELSNSLNAEMVQEQEQEKEQQQEQEQEQEIEIEKYVDLAYCRDHEKQTPWAFKSLASKVAMNQFAQSEGHPPHFYPASEFKLSKREPLVFPHHVLISNNYFDRSWAGARRIKNVIMCLDYVPDKDALIPKVLSSRPLSQLQEDSLHSALKLFSSFSNAETEDPPLNQDDVVQVLKAAGIYDELSEAQFKDIWKECSANGRDVTMGTVKALLLKGDFSRLQEGRRIVAISLAEAETIRRIIHLRNEACHQGHDSWRESDQELGVALRCVSSGNIYFDKSLTFPACEDASMDEEGRLSSYTFTGLSAYEVLRFLNSDMFFSSRSLNTLMRSLHCNSKRERKSFYKNILMCRRRMAKKWSSAPVARLFTLSDHFAMLKQRAQSAALVRAIKEKGMLFYDAFCKFNYSRSGYLSPSEVWGGFEYVGIDMPALDIVEFVTTADSDNDGLLSYREFVEILRDPTKEELGGGPEDIDDEHMHNLQGRRHLSEIASKESEEDSLPVLNRQVSLTPVTPKGEDELRSIISALKLQEEEDEIEAESEEVLRERRIREEMEKEEDERDRLQEGGRNPAVSQDMVRYNFSTGRMPRFVKSNGDVSYCTDEMVGTFLQIHSQSSLLVSNRLPALSSGDGSMNLNQFTLIIEMLWKQRSAPIDETESDATAREIYFPIFAFGNNLSESKAQLWCDNRGRLFTCDGGACSHPDKKLLPNTWHSLALVVDCVAGNFFIYMDGVCLHGNGDEACPLHPPGINDIDGKYCCGNEIILFSDGRSGSSSLPKPDGKDSAIAGIKTFVLQNRCLHSSEVAEFESNLKRERQAGVVLKITENLMQMGVDYQIAQWAATQSEGATLDQRINSALNMVYS